MIIQFLLFREISDVTNTKNKKNAKKKAEIKQNEKNATISADIQFFENRFCKIRFLKAEVAESSERVHSQLSTNF